MIERSRAGCRFFQRLSHRFGVDRIDQTLDEHFVRQQLQGPVTSPTRRVGTGQLDQLLFDVSFDLDLVRTCRLRPVINCRLQSFDDKSFSDVSDCLQTSTQSCDDFVGGVSFSSDTIRQQQNADMGQLTTGRFPFGHELFLRRTFIRKKRDTMLRHHSVPSLDVHPQKDAFKKPELALPVNSRSTAHKHLTAYSQPIGSDDRGNVRTSDVVEEGSGCFLKRPMTRNERGRVPYSQSMTNPGLENRMRDRELHLSRGHRVWRLGLTWLFIGALIGFVGTQIQVRASRSYP